MTPGVSIFSAAAAAAWTVANGSQDSNYPVQNLSDMVRVTNVFRGAPNGSGAVGIKFILPAPASIGFLAFIRHTMTAGNVRVRLWSDNNPDPTGNPGNIIYDSGTTLIWPIGSAPVKGYAATTPMILPSAFAAQSGYIIFSSQTGSIEVGALELAQFWEWDTGEGTQVGFSTTMQDQFIVGGGLDTYGTFTPRMASGQIDYLPLVASAKIGLDFQRTTGYTRPFVFVLDYDNLPLWGRWVFLARNTDLPAMVGALYRVDRFQFRLKEHLR